MRYHVLATDYDGTLAHDGRVDAPTLTEMQMSPHETVAVGDAENAHAFLSLCECAAAVANALPALKEHADIVTRGDHGGGVAELIQGLVADDLQGVEGRLRRHQL